MPPLPPTQPRKRLRRFLRITATLLVLILGSAWIAVRHIAPRTILEPPRSGVDAPLPDGLFSWPVSQSASFGSQRQFSLQLILLHLATKHVPTRRAAHHGNRSLLGTDACERGLKQNSV